MNKSSDIKKQLKNKPGPLICVAVFCAITVVLWQRVQLGFRAGHMDEYDYLFVAKTLLADMTWPTHTYIFGSDFSWYLLGWGDRLLGGLVGARSVAALLGALSLWGVYLFAREVWQSKSIAWVATLILALSAGHIFISRLASYDAVSFCFFALAMMPLLRGCNNSSRFTQRSKNLYIALGMLLLLSAVLTKYTTAAYLPFIGLFILVIAPSQALTAGAMLLTGIGTYLWWHWHDLIVLYEVQISGTHGENTTYKDIIFRSGYYAGGLLCLSIPAILYAKKINQKKAMKTLALLTIFSMPLFLYHLHSKNLISLYKHLNFSLFFLATAAAWSISQWYSHYATYKYSRAVLVRSTPLLISLMIILYTASNHIQLKEMEDGYPDVENLVSHLEDSPMAADSTILSEDPYLFRYLQFNETPQSQIKETSWLDNDEDGKHTHQDVLDALWDRKFSVVLLTDAIHPSKNQQYRHILQQRGYSQSYIEPYQLSSVMTTHLTGRISLYHRQLFNVELVE